ncbi:MAG: peptidoglycan editing factor PgeF [Clostridium perfringens]|nr:peptidoglycan editing factor PgeF [Clostridium perfringens]
MRELIKDNMKFLSYDDDNIFINFSTAFNDVDFKKSTLEGVNNIERLKELFHLDEIFYLNQIHSDKIIDCIKDPIILKGNVDGDALINNKENIGIGVFAADCTPVIVYDKEKRVIAAIHSGWRGTFAKITKKTCEYMIDRYNCNNLNVIIGPHIRQCCYEVSIDLAEKFKEKFGDEVVSDRNLSLEKCIIKQLEGIVNIENITCVNKCTYCDKDIKLHSFRKDGKDSGRLFAFVFMK